MSFTICNVKTTVVFYNSSSCNYNELLFYSKQENNKQNYEATFLSFWKTLCKSQCGYTSFLYVYHQLNKVVLCFNGFTISYFSGSARHLCNCLFLSYFYQSLCAKGNTRIIIQCQPFFASAFTKAVQYARFLLVSNLSINSATAARRPRKNTSVNRDVNSLPGSGTGHSGATLP